LPRAYIRSTTTSRRCSHAVQDVRPAPERPGIHASFIPSVCTVFDLSGQGPLGSTRKLAVADDLVHADAHEALGAQPPAVSNTGGHGRLGGTTGSGHVQHAGIADPVLLLELHAVAPACFRLKPQIHRPAANEARYAVSPNSHTNITQVTRLVNHYFSWWP